MDSIVIRVNLCGNHENFALCGILSYLIYLQTDIATWLAKLELGHYKDKFHAAGYEMEGDMENLKRLDEQQLRNMGISKRGKELFINRG